MRTPWSRLQGAGAVALLSLSLLLLWLRCTASPRTVYLDQDPRGYWIMAPEEVTALPQPKAGAPPALTRFRRSFEADPTAGSVIVHVRALRELELRVNGRRVSALPPAPEDWKQEARADLTELLRPGTNELEASVRNTRGPALLALRIEGLATPLGTDTSWSTQHGDDAPAPALVADDTRPHPSAAAGPRAWDGVVANGGLLLGLFVAAALGCFAWRTRAGPGLRRALPLLALGTGLVSFAASVLVTYARIPVRSGFGFDLGNHLAYVQFVRARHALPLATDGWSMYHPPFYYVVSAALCDAFSLLVPQVDPWSALRVLPLAAGLTNIGVAWALARSLAPGDAPMTLLATLFAAAVPLNLYMAAYPSNEAPHAALAALALLLTVRALLAERAGAGVILWAGAVFGLALLTKFTVLVLLPVAVFFLGLKLGIVERARPTRVAGLLALFLLGAAAVSGWWYVRNVAHFGRPLVGNWELPGDALVWWQQPGFHTAAYYTGFGAALDRPLFSGFHSFWDALYSTFWTDGWLGGRASVGLRRPAFDYGLMTAVALLAVPATAALFIGAVRAMAEALRAPHARQRAALSFLLVSVWVLGFAMLYVTLELPFFAQARAPYGLALIAPLAFLFARGLAPRPGRGWLSGDVAACVLAGWLGALFGASWLALWS
jgi:hypothetical protein